MSSVLSLRKKLNLVRQRFLLRHLITFSCLLRHLCSAAALMLAKSFSGFPVELIIKLTRGYNSELFYKKIYGDIILKHLHTFYCHGNTLGNKNITHKRHLLSHFIYLETKY